MALELMIFSYPGLINWHQINLEKTQESSKYFLPNYYPIQSAVEHSISLESSNY